jgi:hypothetical protein
MKSSASRKESAGKRLFLKSCMVIGEQIQSKRFIYRLSGMVRLLKWIFLPS